MSGPYLCPACKDNATRFRIVHKLAQEVRKDPDTGEILFASDDWESVLAGSGLDLDVHCLRCDYTTGERSFIRAARREERRALR